MKLKPIYLISIVLAVVLLAAAPLAVPVGCEIPEHTVQVQPTQPWTGAPTVPATEAATEAVTQMPTEPPTVPAVTQPPTEAPTEPGPVVYTLSFVGDCTLGGTPAVRGRDGGFDKTVGTDYDYPLAKVRQIFEADDFTMANLEGPLTDRGVPLDKEFVFRGSPAYTAVLSGSSVEAVSNSNNHFYDYGETGMRDTREALDAAGIAHGWRGGFLYTTPSGLTIGVYCDDFSFEKRDMVDTFAALRKKGAEVIVCSFHWGDDRSYTPNADQKTWGRIAIDAGADIVVGHHPHVLQPVEFYGGGVICYSLGNFCYGGNMNPSDKDTAILQQQFIREADGSVTMGETVIIPCSVSSVSNRNNYQPAPLAEDSTAYRRVMDKLAGTWE